MNIIIELCKCENYTNIAASEVEVNVYCCKLV